MTGQRLLLLSCALVMATACATRVDVEFERQTLGTTTPRWLEMARAGDATGIAAMFSEDGVLLRNGRTAVVGPEAVEAFLQDQFARNPDSDDVAAADRIDVGSSGDVAVEKGTWSYPSGGREGQYLTTYRKVNGDWKITSDISVDTTPNGGAPDWAVEFLETWHRLRNAHDEGGLANLYTPDARVGDVRGRPAITAMFASEWDGDAATCAGSYTGFQVVRDTAIGWGNDRCVTAGHDGAADTRTISRWIVLFERQLDGAWLASRDTGEIIGS